MSRFLSDLRPISKESTTSTGRLVKHRTDEVRVRLKVLVCSKSQVFVRNYSGKKFSREGSKM